MEGAGQPDQLGTGRKLLCRGRSEAQLQGQQDEALELALSPVFTTESRPSTPQAMEEAVGMCLEDGGMLRAGQVAFGFGRCMSFGYRFWVGASLERLVFQEL